MDGHHIEEEPPVKNCRRKYLALLLTFFLGLRDGKIILWQAGCDEPCRVFPYRTETLPPAVRSALEAGMAFGCPEDALETAENFLS